MWSPRRALVRALRARRRRGCHRGHVARREPRPALRLRLSSGSACPALSVLFGNVWTVLSPWRAAADAAAWVSERTGVRWETPFAYPERAGPLAGRSPPLRLRRPRARLLGSGRPAGARRRDPHLQRDHVARDARATAAMRGPRTARPSPSTSGCSRGSRPSPSATGGWSSAGRSPASRTSTPVRGRSRSSRSCSARSPSTASARPTTGRSTSVRELTAPGDRALARSRATWSEACSRSPASLLMVVFVALAYIAAMKVAARAVGLRRRPRPTRSSGASSRSRSPTWSRTTSRSSCARSQYLASVRLRSVRLRLGPLRDRGHQARDQRARAEDDLVRRRSRRS